MYLPMKTRLLEYQNLYAIISQIVHKYHPILQKPIKLINDENEFDSCQFEYKKWQILKIEYILNLNSCT